MEVLHPPRSRTRSRPGAQTRTQRPRKPALAQTPPDPYIIAAFTSRRYAHAKQALLQPAYKSNAVLSKSGQRTEKGIAVRLGRQTHAPVHPWAALARANDLSIDAESADMLFLNQRHRFDADL